MAAKDTQSRTYNVPAHILMNLIKSPNLTAAASLTVSVCDDYRMIYTFKHGVSFTSWGETVTIQLVPVAENVTNLYITSECSLPTQIVDWGKNAENITKIMCYLDSSVNYAMMNYAQPPVVNQAPVQSVCRNCGAKLLDGAAFCTSCGTKTGT